MKSNKVRGRDGAVRVVNFDYVLQDGEARVVELPFMDARGRTMVHEGRGHPPGNDRASCTATAMKRPNANGSMPKLNCADAIGERWRGQRWRGPQTKPPSKPALVFDSPEAAVAAAYLQYADAIQQRWRK